MIKYTLAAMIAASPALAQQQNCAPRDNVTSELLETYGEYVVDSGLSRQGVVEMYANGDTGTWTMVITAPNGISCVVAHGKHFTRMLFPPNT